MEYPSKYDFFLEFKSVFNEDGHFIDYILVNISDNFQCITNIKNERILGMKISEIVTD